MKGVIAAGCAVMSFRPCQFCYLIARNVTGVILGKLGNVADHLHNVVVIVCKNTPLEIKISEN